MVYLLCIENGIGVHLIYNHNFDKPKLLSCVSSHSLLYINNTKSLSFEREHTTLTFKILVIVITPFIIPELQCHKWDMDSMPAILVAS